MDLGQLIVSLVAYVLSILGMWFLVPALMRFQQQLPQGRWMSEAPLFERAEFLKYWRVLTGIVATVVLALYLTLGIR